jgi:hypothetical protein
MSELQPEDVPEPDLGEPLPYVMCVEHYRQMEARHDAEDYFVDGLVLIHIPLPERTGRVDIETAMKRIILQLQAPDHAQEIAKSFPKFHAMREQESLWWYHLMRKDRKERLPQDFHTNDFTEEELLGTAPAEDPDLLPMEMWFDRDGDPIEGPPDRMMAFLYS